MKEYPEIIYSRDLELDPRKLVVNPYLTRAIMLDLGFEPEVIGTTRVIVSHKGMLGGYVTLADENPDIHLSTSNVVPKEISKFFIHEAQHLHDKIYHRHILENDITWRKRSVLIGGISLALSGLRSFDASSPEDMVFSCGNIFLLGLMGMITGPMAQYLMFSKSEKRANAAVRKLLDNNPDYLNVVSQSH